MKLLNTYNMGGKKRRRIAQEAKDTAAASLASAQGEQAKAMADVQSQKAAYENFQFENPVYFDCLVSESILESTLAL